MKLCSPSPPLGVRWWFPFSVRASWVWCSLMTPAFAAERFPFVIPGDDATPSATDLSGLSPRPAGADGFVQIRDGHFHTDAGRLRMWGVNTCFGANFPAPADAEKAAAHLAKLGVNGVRMHHHDTAPAPRGVLGPVVDGQRALDPQQLDRQDYFLDQLHRHGIYANLNLHVGRTFTEAEGFVSRDLPRAVRYDKYLLYFEPRMRERFKEFCRAYLLHRNPYRQLRRVDDPGIAMIEITNENAFSRDGAQIAASLPEPYRGEFQRQWNRWLTERYRSTAALRTAWSTDLEPLGDSVVSPAPWTDGFGAWRLRQNETYPVRAAFGQPGPEADVKAVTLDIVRPAPETSLQELQLPNLSLDAGRTYTLAFWVKAAAPRPLFVDVSFQGPPNWRSLGCRDTVAVGTDWQRMVRVFRATETVAGKARICFKFGGAEADLQLAAVSLRRGGEWTVVPPGQGLEQANLDIPVDGWCDAAQADVRQFMVDTETAFIRDLVNFLKEELGVRVPTTASQITYHGAEIVAATCDYADIHAYWQHPRFPRRPWDPVDWTIANTPMEAVPDNDRLLACAPWRLFDRPFTMSEWNIPDPHDYAASVVPFAALVAALQDWDGVFFFQYHSSEDDWFPDRMRGYFSFNGQPVKLALLTACAHWYRRGDLAPLADTAAGTLAERLPATLALSRRIGITPQAAKPAELAAPSDKRLASPDGRAVWDATDPQQAQVQVNTPASRAVWGLIGGRTFDLGGLKVDVGPADRNYAVLVITSLDGRPLEKSQRMLLVTVGSAENQNMGWNEARTSVGNRWGTGPTQVNGVPAVLTLPGVVRHAYALDGRGQRAGEVPVRAAPGQSQLTIGPQYQTLWYELVAE